MLCLVALEAVLVEHADDGLLERYLVLADDEPAVVDHGLVGFAVPLVRRDVLRGVARLRVHVEYFLDELSAVVANPVGNFELAVNDLLVEYVGVLVLEGQVAADHGKQDDSAGPDVYLGPMIGLATDHLWRRIARRTTSSSQRFVASISVRQAKVD